MKDYKNVKVPRSFRSSSNRVTVKRVETRRGAGRAGLDKAARRYLLFVALIAASWLTWQAYQTLLHAELFQIAGVDVSGVKQVGEAELRDIARVFTGRTIFHADLEAAADRARANPWVREVRVHRRLPNRISMVFTERVPCFILDTGSGRYLLDGDGVVIDGLETKTGLSWRLPVVAVRDFRVQRGEPAASDGIAEAMALIAELSGRGGWRMDEVTVKAASPETLSVLYAGREFKIGAGNYAEKFRRLAEIMADGQQRGLELAYVDLRPERQAAAMARKIQHKARSSE